MRWKHIHGITLERSFSWWLNGQRVEICDFICLFPSIKFFFCSGVRFQSLFRWVINAIVTIYSHLLKLIHSFHWRHGFQFIYCCDWRIKINVIRVCLNLWASHSYVAMQTFLFHSHLCHFNIIILIKFIH